MAEHLPECLTPDPASPEILCICAALRACEARAREEVHESEYRLRAQAFRMGREEGVQAAREAVAAAPGTYSGYPLVERVKALAAIDALRADHA